MVGAQNIFLITGVSRGLGAAFASAALAAGHRVIGTVRTREQASAFEALAPACAQAIVVDLSSPNEVHAALQITRSSLARVDILVNNAGYGHEGPLEETPLDELREQIEVNLFAPVAFIQAVLPGMRDRRHGHIVNVTSMAAAVGFPGISYYCSSKFALDGLSEALAKELRPFGIFVTSFAPGQFRTDWAGESMRRSPRRIADYDASFDPVRDARLAKSGMQPGDPARAADVLMALVTASNPPSRLFVGADALLLASQKIKRAQAEIGAWADQSRSTDFQGDS